MGMITTLTKTQLKEYISKQLNYLYPDNKIVDLGDYDQAIMMALDRLEYCFKHCTLKQYNDGKNTYFNHLYSDHYVMYLWYLSNTLWSIKSDIALCNKLYYLNKTLNGLDCMYSTELPDIFLVFHSLGTMLGKAKYSNFFVALQGCTIGAHNGKYPELSEGVALTAHSSIIGNCKIGKLVSIGANTSVFEKDISDNSVVYRDQSGKLSIRSSDSSFAQTFFNVAI